MNAVGLKAHDPASVFRARELTRTYGSGTTEVHALRGVSFEVLRGEFIVLLGPSGSGKSTLLNILGGLDVPSSGELFWGDMDLAHADERALTRFRREHVGFVFQFYNLIASLTARENVELVTDLLQDTMSAPDALALVGLADRLDHFPAQLSGGEQQRVALARAIAKRPACLLCDEPTGALDFETGRLVLEAIERVNRDLGTTTIVITHNAVIAQMANRVLRLANGVLGEVVVNSHRASPAELHW